MVSLAVAETLSHQLKGRPNKIISLRDSALWFPHIPESHLQLNEGGFRSSRTAASGFRPLCCTFGNTKNPASPFKISIISKFRHTLTIKCHYDTHDVKKLGLEPYSTRETQISVYVIKRVTEKRSDKITFLKHRKPERTPEASDYFMHFLFHKSRSPMLKRCSIRILISSSRTIDRMCQPGPPC
jgi:hypothetical protein